MDPHPKSASLNSRFEDDFSDWEHFLAEMASSTILWSLSHGYLNFDGKPIYLHTVNRTSLYFFKAAIESCRNALLIYPSSKPNITSLLSLEALYWKVSDKNRPNLLVISDRLELRDEIKTCFMSFKANNMPLHRNFFPVGIITKSGKIFDATKAKIPPRLLISANPAILPEKLISGNFFGAIAEVASTYDIRQLETLKKWVHDYKIPFIFYVSADPPSDTVLGLIDGGIPYWGWNRSSLKNDCIKDHQRASRLSINTQSIFCNNFKEIENRSNGVKRVIIPVKEDKLNQLFENARGNYCNMLKTARNESNAPALDALHRFLGVVYSLEELIAPLSYSELEFSRRWGMRRIADRIEGLRLRNQVLEQWNPTFASYYSKSIIELESLYEYMDGHASGKPSIVLQAMYEAKSRGSAFLILSKNDASNAALIAFLHDKTGKSQEDFEKEKILLRAVDAASGISRVDTSIIYGSPRYHQRYLLELSLTERLGILAYKSEILSLRYLEKNLDKNSALFSPSCRIRSIASIKGSIPKIMGSAKPKNMDFEKEPASKIIEINPLDAETDEKNYGSIFSDFLSQDFRIEYEESTEATRDYEHRALGIDSGNEYIEAIKANLTERKYIFLDVDKNVLVYEDFNDKIKEKPARSLKSNDILVLINNSTSKSLAEEIIGKVEMHPKMTELVFYQKLWILLLRQAVIETGDKPAEVVRKLHERGARSPKTSMAVHFWIRGKVIGPNENENIRRIGEIYDKKMLIENYNEIVSAIQRLRAIHLSLSRKLRWLIPRAGVAKEMENIENPIVDEELNLYLEDFANTISMERVQSISGLSRIKAEAADKLLSEGDIL